MSFEPFTVVEVPFPFLDRPARKTRPALVISATELSAEQGIVVLAMITSAKRSRWWGDVEIRKPETAGLRAPSIVRWKVFTIESGLISSARGVLADEDRELVRGSMRRALAAV